MVWNLSNKHNAVDTEELHKMFNRLELFKDISYIVVFGQKYMHMHKISLDN